jgi:hypothetical protein
MGDCYIVLHSKQIKTPLTLDTLQQSDSGNEVWNHTIYTWIGNDAELDKRFCCAMFAVGLKSWLDVKTPVMRQVFYFIYFIFKFNIN